MVPFLVTRMPYRTPRGKETNMNRLALLIALVLSCSRTPLGLHVPDGGLPGAGGAGGSVVVLTVRGGSLGNGGAGGGMGGAASGSGGSRAAGGATGTGGSISAYGGSTATSDLDTCSIDSDCTACIWETSPTDSSQCAHSYCCGGMIASKKRCEANQAAWSSYCPNQSPQDDICKCVGCEGQAIGCVGGQCGLWCHPVGDAGGDVVLPIVDGGVDAAQSEAGTPIAEIIETHSTNYAGFDVLVYSDGSATQTTVPSRGCGYEGSDAADCQSSSSYYPPGTPIVMRFLADLQAVGDLSNIPTASYCGKSTSFGTYTTVSANGKSSGDLQCMVNPTAAQCALYADCIALTSFPGTSSGGSVCP
jgi:hypothetical protein